MRSPFLAALVALPLALALAGCGKTEKPNPRWEKAAASAEERQKAPVPPPPVVAGGEVNAFFPKAIDGYARTFTQEKPGFAEAKITKDGKELATASISDTEGNPDARGKFSSAKEQVAGSPLVTVGANQSALLVAGRWQVKVSSTTLDPAARKALLERFDLAGLSKLQPPKDKP